MWDCRVRTKKNPPRQEEQSSALKLHRPMYRSFGGTASASAAGREGVRGPLITHYHKLLGFVPETPVTSPLIKLSVLQPRSDTKL